jgi:hypothetical protein
MENSLDGKDPVALLAQALRSGAFKQTRNALMAEDGCCCLGVACLVYQDVVGGLEIVERPRVNPTDRIRWSFDGHTYDLPAKVKRWYGLSSNSGNYDAASLMCHNDAQHGTEDHMTFPQIADLIESRPAGLFAEQPVAA